MTGRSSIIRLQNHCAGVDKMIPRIPSRYHC